jgi:Transposase and inactivated derivatives
MMTLTQPYPTDLTIIEWQQLMDFFPTAHVRGRPRKGATWLILNALLYVTRTGCQGRMRPRDFPPWQTGYGYCWRWTRSGRWERLNTVLLQTARQQAGRNPQPRAALIDSQSVKTADGGEARGVDVPKQPNGRNRHIVVDVLGLVLTVVVHSAGLPDGRGGKLPLPRLFARVNRNVHNRWGRRKLLWADGTYEALIPYVRNQCGWTLEVVRRPPDAKGLQCCRAAGWWNARAGGLGATVACAATSNIPRSPAKRWSTGPVSAARSGGLQRKNRIKKYFLSVAGGESGRAHR